MEKVKSFFKNLIYTEGMTPLPGKIIMCVFLLMLFNSITMTMIFSFLPKLVKSFGTTEVETGYKVGLVASAMYVGRTCFSLFWGYIADSKGTKKTAILSGSLLTVTTIAFGFCFNIPWAIATRFFHGCSMGVVIITKAIVSEVCDETNSALGMSILLSALSTGLIIGPSIGGFLSFPDELYPNTFSEDSLFGRFSVLLPSVIIAVGFIVTIVLSIIFLPKDKPNQDGEKACLIIESKMKSKYIYETEQKSNRDAESYLLYSTSTPPSQENVTYSDFEIKRILIEESSSISDKCCSFSIFKQLKRSKLMTILRTKECVTASLMYGAYSLVAIGFDELYPLYAATSRRYHGYGFSTSNISTALLFAAFLLLIAQITILPKVIANYGARKLFIYSGLVQALLFPIIPALEFISNQKLFWIFMIFILLTIRASLTSSLLAVNILLNNSVSQELVGSANGLGMTFANISRIIAPSMFGSLFAWSLRNVKEVFENTNASGFPLNHFFTFFILSLISTINAIWVIFVFPRSLDNREQNDESNVYDRVSISSFKAETVDTKL